MKQVDVNLSIFIKQSLKKHVMTFKTQKTPFIPSILWRGEPLFYVLPLPQVTKRETEIPAFVEKNISFRD